MSVFQRAPEGIWRSSPKRILLWACEQVRLVKAMDDEQPIIDSYAGKLAKILNEPVKAYDWKALHAAVVKAEDEDVPREIVDGWAWDEFEQTLAALWVEGADFRTDGLGLDYDPDVLAAALGNVGDLVTSIGDNTAERLRFMMNEYLAKPGVSQFEFAKAIRDEWATASQASAERIAVTEWNRAASSATMISYRAQGIERKVWFTVGGACAICVGNAAAGEIPMADLFPSGHDAPPAHPWCRCNVAAGYAKQ